MGNETFHRQACAMLELPSAHRQTNKQDYHSHGSQTFSATRVPVLKHMLFGQEETFPRRSPFFQHKAKIMFAGIHDVGYRYEDGNRNIKSAHLGV